MSLNIILGLIGFIICFTFFILFLSFIFVYNFYNNWIIWPKNCNSLFIAIGLLLIGIILAWHGF